MKKSYKELDKRLIEIRPNRRQRMHQEMEFYGFIHFTVNTFTGKEWGDGTEQAAIFNPEQLDVNQWVNIAKEAGMKGLILTCKHHDGFCLWPSSFTEHSMKNSPYKGGRGDIVGELSEACQKAGLKFGVYLSPWDRNQSTYGTGEIYNDFFVNQLTELLENYGELFSVWFDGACGEGSNGRVQQYDWDRYYGVIRRLQPNACITVCGPDVRWCGNEAGQTRQSEWSVVPKRLSWAETVEGKSQRADNTEFRERRLASEDLELGSREVLQAEEELIWYPAEVNTSIRPGWFYHEEEDDKVKSFEELRDIYLKSVGGNATFLLNIPPTKAGLLHERDARELRKLGAFIRDTFCHNLIEDGLKEMEVAIRWKEAKQVSYVVLQENLEFGQRIEEFRLYSRDEKGGETLLGQGTTIGYKKIVELPQPTSTKELIIRITDVRVSPRLSFIGAY